MVQDRVWTLHLPPSLFPFSFPYNPLSSSLPFLPNFHPPPPPPPVFSPSSIDHCLHSFLSNSFLCLFSLSLFSFLPRFPFVQSYSISAFLPVFFQSCHIQVFRASFYYFFFFFSFLCLRYCISFSA